MFRGKVIPPNQSARPVVLHCGAMRQFKLFKARIKWTHLRSQWMEGRLFVQKESHRVISDFVNRAAQ